MKHVNTFKIVAALVLILTGIFWLIKAVADIFAGVQGGINNLIVAVVLFILAFFDWKRPLLGGIVTATLGVILAVYFNLVLPTIYVAYIPLLLICAPLVIGALLFIEADWASKNRN
jgi:hypothetical protein